MITQQEFQPASPRQIRWGAYHRVDAEKNQMSGALVGYYVQKDQLFRRLRRLRRKPRML